MVGQLAVISVDYRVSTDLSEFFFKLFDPSFEVIGVAEIG
jgi:hypothetical protein